MPSSANWRLARLSPASSLYRWLLAWSLLTPFMARAVWQQRQQIRPYLRQLMVLALLGMMLNQSLGYYAAQSISAVNIGILNALIPLLTVLLSLWLLRERPTLGIATGSLLSFAGLLWLVSQGNPARLLAQGISHGDLLMVRGCLHLCPVWRTAQTLVAAILRMDDALPADECCTALAIPGFSACQQLGVTADNLPLVLYAVLPRLAARHPVLAARRSPSRGQSHRHFHESASAVYLGDRGAVARGATAWLSPVGWWTGVAGGSALLPTLAPSAKIRC